MLLQEGCFKVPGVHGCALEGAIVVSCGVTRASCNGVFPRQIRKGAIRDLTGIPRQVGGGARGGRQGQDQGLGTRWCRVASWYLVVMWWRLVVPVVVLVEGVEANNGAIHDLTGIPRQVGEGGRLRSSRSSVLYAQGGGALRGCCKVP